MARLKMLEVERSASTKAAVIDALKVDSQLPPLPATQAGKGKSTRPNRPDVAPGSEEESLYIAFGQMFHEMLEDDGDDA